MTSKFKTSISFPAKLVLKEKSQLDKDHFMTCMYKHTQEAIKVLEKDNRHGDFIEVLKDIGSEDVEGSHGP